MHRVIYVSGKISNHGESSLDEQNINIEIARKVSLALWKLPNVYVVCPHINSPWTTEPDPHAAFDFVFKGIPEEQKHKKILEADIDILDRCDIIFMLNNWVDSKGAIIEHDYAIANGIPVFYKINELEKYLKTNPKSCNMCGKIRTATEKILKKDYCNKCFGTINSIIGEETQKANRDFIKIPRNP